MLADAGVGSRRRCDDLIAEGRVEVDGRIAVPGQRVDPATAVVRVDGDRIVTAADRVYLAFNKPAGVVTTMSDPEGRACLGDYLIDRRERLFHVGRLDADTEGLLLLTNDGDLAHRLAHPSHGVQKTYVATVPGPVARDVGRRLRAGVELEDGPVRVDSFRLLQATPGRALVEVVLHEGRKHVVRRMLAEVGHPVESLVRTRIGPISLGQQRPGTLRVVAGDELGALYTAVGL